MFLGFYLRPDLFDASIGPDKKGHAMGAHIFTSPKSFLAPDAIGFDDFLVLISQQCERQAVFPYELVVGFHGIRADAEDDGAVFVEFRKRIAKSTGFLGATRGVVFRIKIEDDVFAL